VKLSVCIITLNEEANIGRTLKSVQPLVADGQGEIIVVDSGSTDRTVEIAKSLGAKVFTEPWKGFAAQKNSALEKAQGEWILSLDADEEVDSALRSSISRYMKIETEHRTYPSRNDISDSDSDRVFDEAFSLGIEDAMDGFRLPRKNFFLGRWIKHGGFYPDQKIRLFRKSKGTVPLRLVHEDPSVDGPLGEFEKGDLLHHAYPTLSGYIEHMNKYSSLGAEMETEKGRRGFSFLNIVIRPWLTFIYNYFFRLGFLDGKEGLLLHMYHAVYVSWKYAKVWELGRAESASKKNAAS
jgi:glycosyltransferase involved in cell wall biosynthesis